MSDYIDVWEPPLDTVSNVLEKLCKQDNKPLFSGGSSRGWSRYSTLQRCPRLYRLKYIDNRTDHTEFSEVSESLEVGTVFHAFLSMYYSKNWWTPEELLEKLLKENCSATFVAEGWRVFDAYRNEYAFDYIEPLGVEVTAVDVNGNSCRYDLIARIKANVQGGKNLQHGLIPGGVYIFEHKTVKTFFDKTQDGWDMDGEIRGELALWDRCDNLRQYGKLSGLVINLISREKKPKAKRTLIVSTDFAMKHHLQTLDEWTQIEDIYKARGVWPQAMSNCVNKYGRCQFFNYCRNGGK